ncbi:unnamed protein product [Lupinus luteus]|uniref:Uncharacterized protein n=1 Tax=Lupinus luteus TaxID=3873 RepID=A0AAV1XGL0_LUPLU
MTPFTVLVIGAAFLQHRGQLVNLNKIDLTSKRMRRACRKMLRSVPCTSRKSMRTDSMKDMEEILRAKLSTIKEEPELCEENLTQPRCLRVTEKQRKKIQAKYKIGQCLVPHVNLKQSYVLFISGFATKSTFFGFLQP